MEQAYNVEDLSEYTIAQKCLDLSHYYTVFLQGH